MGPPEGKGKGQDLARAMLTGLGLKLPVSRTHRGVRRAVGILEENGQRGQMARGVRATDADPGWGQRRRALDRRGGH